MRTPLAARRCSGLGAAFGFAATLAAQAPLPPAVNAPVRFERILWCSSPQRAAIGKQLGYTGIQLGRGTDPAIARDAGLGYYLDQPIGKGYLELRDAEWKPIQQAYERTRDPAVLVRPKCFATPGLTEAEAQAAAAEAERMRGPGLLFVALADEASATRHDAPLDTCRCQHCTAAFRAFARQRHGTIDALNQALGTQFGSFDDVDALTTDQVRRRELGGTNLPANLQPFALRQEFTDEQFAAAVRTIAAKVQAAVPGVPVGLTGLQVPSAFGGNDHSRLLPGLTLAEPYAIGGAVELARCLLPRGAHRYATLFPPDAGSPEAEVPLGSIVQARLTGMAFEGLAGVVVWNDETVADAAGKASPFGEVVAATMQRLQPVLDACAGATLQRQQVWVVESQASVRAWWMLDSAGDGMTWIRRLGSYEREHSTSQAVRLGWIRLLQDLGMQPLFVAEAELAERLLQERPRCLVLPATIALADRSVQSITAYVRSGGTVMADHSTALYDGNLVRRPAGGLDGLFGITHRSLALADLLVRQGRSVSGEAGVPLVERGLVGGIGERRPDGEVFLERVSERGRAVYLNAPVVEYRRWRLDEQHVAAARDLRRRVRAVLQQAGVEAPFEVRGDGLPTCLERALLTLRDGRTVLALRLNALESPRLLHRLAQSGPRPIHIVLRAAQTLRHLGGEDLGTKDHFELQLDPFGALFLEIAR